MQKEEIKIIEEKLSLLLNQPLCYVNRAANMLDLGFGENITIERTIGRDKNGKLIKGVKEISKYILHADCFFRFTLEDQVILAKQDIFYPNAEIGYREDFDWEDFDCNAKGVTRFEEQVKDFFSPDEINDYVVKSIKANKFGDITIIFTNGAILEIINENSLDEEVWRFFGADENEPHFVVRGYGIEINECLKSAKG